MSINTRDTSKVFNNGPLHIAVKQADTQAVMTLIAGSVNIDVRNSQGRTPLHCATNYKIVKDLLTAGADINALDKEGNSPLHVAVMHGFVPIVQLLLHVGADSALKSTARGNTALHLATDPLFRHASIVQLLLQAKAQVDACNNFGETALHLASKHKMGPIDRNVVKMLVQAGADINALNALSQKAAEYKDSPLHDAVCKGDVKAVVHAIESKSNVNARDIYGKTALFDAVNSYNGSSVIVRTLLAAGADITICDATGSTPFHESIRLGQISIIRLLLNAGADVNKQNSTGDSCLHIAVKSGYRKALRGFVPIAKFLIQNGADLSLKNHEGKTADKFAKIDLMKSVFI